MLLGITQSIFSQKSKGHQNVFWDGSETLNCFYSDELIAPNSKGGYHFFYSSNEDRRVYEKTLSRPQRFPFYKFKTKEYAQNWCDGIPFETKHNHIETSKITTKHVEDTKLKTVHDNAEISNFVSGQSQKKPSLEHFTTDGYELTKYIKVSEIPYLMNKLTELQKFHHTGYTNYRNERITCKEDDIPGYILRKESYFDYDKRENIRDDKRYYYNSKAIDIIYDYLSKFGYSYFDQKIIQDLKWNNKEVKESCAKTYQRYEHKTCPNCNGESRFIDNSDKYSTESRSVMQNCTSCDRTFQFTVWNWNSRGWKTHNEKKLGYVKCGGCRGYGYTESYHGKGYTNGVTTKKCHVLSCNNGWDKCSKCYGKGQKERTVYVEKKHVTTKKNGCSRCNNSGVVNTGKIKTYTCSSCYGKGYTFKRIRNPEWETIGKYYRGSKKLYTKIFSKYNGKMRPDGFRVDSWKKWVGVEEDNGYAFLGNKKYLTLATSSGTHGEKYFTNYNDLDFVQIAFQRNLNDPRRALETKASSLNNKYVGEWKDGKKSGQGTYTFADGSKYVGEWKEGKRFGQGTKTWTDGSKYVGEWKAGKKSGQGTNTFDGGSKYVGEWKDGEHHGQGIYTWPSGSKYVGEWKDGKQHGQGTKTWTDGSKYVGEWKAGKKSGQGTNTFDDGSKYVGEWKDGKQHGQGTYTWPSGSKYVGEWNEGKRHNHGTLTFADGSKSTVAYRYGIKYCCDN